MKQTNHLSHPYTGCAGWQDSKGCQEEYVYAKDNGIRVIPFFKWMMGIWP